MTETINAIRRQSGTALGAALLSLAVALAGCDPNLAVENPNQPDRERALATGSDVESIIVASFSAYHDVAHSDLGGVLSECGGTSWTAVYNALADHSTSNWANYGFSDTANQPREALPNSSADPDACLWATPWFRAYQGLAAASEGLKAMEAGVDIGEDGANNARARAWAKLNQGTLHGMLSLLFDKGFVVDETVALTDEQGNANIPEFSSYQEMNSAAIGYLQSAIQIANNNDFTTPAGWTNGRALTSDELAALAHSYIARFMARWPRNPSEAQSVDWASVQSHLEQGHDFRFAESNTAGFWSGLEVWGEWGGAAFPFAFVDNKTVGPADQSGAYQDWLNAPVNESVPFDVQTPDERIPEPVQTLTLEDGTPITQNLGCYPAAIFGVSVQEATGPGPDTEMCGQAPSFIGYQVGTFMPRARGVIGLSHYARYETNYGPCSMLQADFSFDGVVCDFTQMDKSFLMAEALWRQGDAQAAADILNEFREGAGVGEAGPNGVSENADGECVPRMPDGSCADFLHTLAYEKGLAVSAEHTGDMWADKRRWGLLTTGTPVQVPIPAQELATLGEEIYTFGGDAGGAAPVIQPGDKESILKKIHWSLSVLEAQRQARGAKRPSISGIGGDGMPTGEPPTGVR